MEKKDIVLKNSYHKKTDFKRRRAWRWDVLVNYNREKETQSRIDEVGSSEVPEEVGGEVKEMIHKDTVEEESIEDIKTRHSRTKESTERTL